MKINKTSKYFAVAAIFATSISALSVANAAGTPSNQSLLLSFSGVVPTLPIVSNGWTISDISGNNVTNASGVLSITRLADDNYKMTTTSAIQLRAVATSNKFDAGSITAYLAAPVSFVGTNATETPLLNIYINGARVSSSNQNNATVVAQASESDNSVSLVMTAEGSADSTALTPGQQISANATLILTASVV